MKPLFPLILIAIFLTGCSTTTSSHGKSVTIQLRRGDALGETRKPAETLSPLARGANSAIAGKIQKAGKDWVILDTRDGEVWIPTSSILLIEFSEK